MKPHKGLSAHINNQSLLSHWIIDGGWVLQFIPHNLNTYLHSGSPTKPPVYCTGIYIHSPLVFQLQSLALSPCTGSRVETKQDAKRESEIPDLLYLSTYQCYIFQIACKHPKKPNWQLEKYWGITFAHENVGNDWCHELRIKGRDFDENLSRIVSFLYITWG